MKIILAFLTFTSLLFIPAHGQENKSLLWEVKSPGGKKSYLFGTYHLVGSDYLKSNERANEAYKKSGTVVVETIIDSTKMMDMAMMGMMPGRSLKKMVDSADYVLLKKEIMRVTGYDLAMFDQMKPMTIIALYLVAVAEEAEVDEALMTGQPIDLYFATNGKKLGKEVVQLETMMEQAEILYNSETVEEQAEMLVQAVKESAENHSSSEDLLEAYFDEDLDRIWKLANSEEQEYWDMGLLLDNRNTRWISKLKPVLDKGGAFIAVGALHLPGSAGLLQLLRAAGYGVEPVHNL